jgi:hypothetical protein
MTCRVPAAVFVALAWSATATAAAPADYGWQFELQLDGDGVAHRVVLSPAVYARSSDPLLRDIEAFNAAGESLSFGPVPQRADDPAAMSSSVSWFLLPPDAAGDGANDMRLHIERDASGRLRRLHTDVAATSQRAAQPHLLVDLGGSDQAAEALEFDWRRSADVSARFRILAGDDLVDWRPLRSDARLADLQHGERRLLRQRIELPPTRARYLLLVRGDDGPALDIIAVRATARPPQEATAGIQWLDIEGHADPDQHGAFRYSTPGPLPVGWLAVEPSARNAVAAVELASRAGPDAPWRSRVRFTAFLIGDGDDALGSDPQRIAVTRDREWRLVADPALDRPPRLRVGYTPDAFALLARGEPPYILAAGSARARRPEHPMAALLGTLRERSGADFALADARIGAETELGGAAVLQPPVPWTRWLLWATLVGSALVVIGMVVGLLRSGVAQGRGEAGVELGGDGGDGGD